MISLAEHQAEIFSPRCLFSRTNPKLEGLWRSSAQYIINPRADLETNEFFSALEPTLNGLSRRDQSLLSFLLMNETVSLESLGYLPEWDDRTWNKNWGSNEVLVMVALACGLGIWEVPVGSSQPILRQTPFGASLANKWDYKRENIRHLFERCWSQKLEEEILKARMWAWEALQNEPCKGIFKELTKHPCGIDHDEAVSRFGSETHGENTVFRALIAASTIGAAWFTGMRWEPTMFGAYLAFTQDSALNRPRRLSVMAPA